MSLWLLIPLLAIAAIIQSTLVPDLLIAGFKLDFTLMLVLSRGLTAQDGKAFGWGLGLGVFLDLASGLPFGSLTLALTIIGALTSLEIVDGLRGNLIFAPAAMIVATLVEHVIVLTLLALTNHTVEWSDYLISVTLPSAILNTFFLPVVYFPVLWLTGRRESR